MNRDFNWLMEKYGDESRNILEKICLDVFNKKYVDDEVQDVKPNPGDEGIDVFVSHENDDFTIIQCKFYLGELTSSRKSAIKDSYKKAIDTKGNIITTWILCTPKVFTNKEQDWWEKWKKDKKKEYKEKYNKTLKISLLSGN